MAHELNVLILNPFHGGSHAQWADALQQNWGGLKNRKISLLTLPGRHWKWRMHASSAEFARQCALTTTLPHAIICTDMMDVATFKGMLRKDWAGVPVIQYFHENQITFPWSPADKDAQTGRDRTYGMMNILSAMASDAIWFNSHFHRKKFLDAIPKFMHPMPDEKHVFSEHPFEKKSSVVPIGIAYPENVDAQRKCNDAPTILWNHRWEFDKAPEFLLNALRDFEAHGLSFSLILTGPQFSSTPPALDQIVSNFQANIIHQGYCENRKDYQQLLMRSDFVIHSPKQEYFGISILEALAHGVIPILGRGNAYEDWCQEKFLVDDAKTLRCRYQEFSREPTPHRNDARKIAKQFKWEEVIRLYDSALISLLKG